MTRPIAVDLSGAMGGSGRPRRVSGETVRSALSAEPDREEIGGLIDGLGLHALLYPDRLPSGRRQRLMESALELLE